MADISMDSTSAKIKSFWQRPEGTSGMITLGLLGLGGFFLLSAFGPVITGGLTALSGIVAGVAGLTLHAAYLVINLALLAATIFVVTNKKFLLLSSYMFKSAMRALTGWLVEIDPIGIMKNYIDQLKEKYQILKAQIDKLTGEIRICQTQIDSNTTEANKAASVAKEAQRQLAAHPEYRSQLMLSTNQVRRLTESNTKLTTLLKQMQFILMALKKYKDAADVVIQDMSADVKVKSEERKAILMASGAIKTAKALLRGDPDERELYDQALQFVVDDYAQRYGEIESFMDDAKPFIDSLDLQNGASNSDALAQLQAWSSKADSILLGGEKIKMIEHFETEGSGQQISSTAAPEKAVAAGVTGGEDFHQFFKS